MLETDRREIKRVRSKEWRTTNPDRFKSSIRNATLLKKYGIDLAGYQELFEAQQGLCAVCKSPERIRKNLSVDHDHQTNKIRGLLCHHCNAALGHVNDDITLLKSLIYYLEVTQ